MARSLRDHCTGWIDARSNNKTRINRLFYAERVTSQIPDRGKSRHQKIVCIGGRAYLHKVLADGEQLYLWQIIKGYMGMSIDQPRHQCATTAIDDLRPFGLDFFCRDLLDEVSFDQHVRVHKTLFILAVEHIYIREQRFGFGLRRFVSGKCCYRQTKC